MTEFALYTLARERQAALRREACARHLLAAAGAPSRFAAALAGLLRPRRAAPVATLCAAC